MGRHTPEKIKEILAVYDELKSYKAVGRKLGINEKTVAKYVEARRNSRNDVGDNPSLPADSESARHIGSQQSTSFNPSTIFAEFLRRREQGDSMKQVILDLNLSFEEATKHEIDYMAVNGFENFEDLYKRHNKHIRQILRLADLMVDAGLDPDGFVRQMGEVRTLGGKLTEMTTKLQNEEALFTVAFARRAQEEEKIIRAGKELQSLNVKISKAKEDFCIDFNNVQVLETKKDALKQVIANLKAIADGTAARL